jgi:hypothetical protein
MLLLDYTEITALPLNAADAKFNFFKDHYLRFDYQLLGFLGIDFMKPNSTTTEIPENSPSYKLNYPFHKII